MTELKNLFDDRGHFSYMTPAAVVELNLVHLATLENTAKYNEISKSTKLSEKSMILENNSSSWGFCPIQKKYRHPVTFTKDPLYDPWGKHSWLFSLKTFQSLDGNTALGVFSGSYNSYHRSGATNTRTMYLRNLVMVTDEILEDKTLILIMFRNVAPSEGIVQPDASKDILLWWNRGHYWPPPADSSRRFSRSPSANERRGSKSPNSSPSRFANNGPRKNEGDKRNFDNE